MGQYWSFNARIIFTFLSTNKVDYIEIVYIIVALLTLLLPGKQVTATTCYTEDISNVHFVWVHLVNISNIMEKEK